MHILVYTLCAVIVLTVVAFGQVNIEASRLPQNSEDGIYITSELGYEFKRGNTHVTEIKSKLRTDYIKGKHHTLLFQQTLSCVVAENTWERSTEHRNRERILATRIYMYLWQSNGSGFSRIR